MRCQFYPFTEERKLTNRQQTEGVVCHALPFQDHDVILTVFTEKEGMVKFFLKKGLIRKEWRGAAISPLTRAEFIYVQGKGEMLSCREISILSMHLKLRESLPRLNAALEMIRSLRKAYFAAAPVPLIYHLLNRYLEAVSSVQDPFVLTSSLRLKILFHEGMFAPEPCESFADEEWPIIAKLTLNRTPSFFNDFILPPVLHQKIADFFESHY